MAAEMPVKDVLCEAMEYLSRLGSNLRTRSENLKEKKIRKDKLTNALAVQKAAAKVLLICELSKKSLVNVETGVRKILEHIDTSQASSSVGGKSSRSNNNESGKKRDDKPKYYYFDYKSRKLKIKHKISLKHYRSMKVLANKMSKSVIDKYPVFYDCKLYRIRRKKLQSKRKKDSESGQEEPETVKNKGFNTDSSSQALTPEHPQNNTETGVLKTKENRRSSESGKSSSIISNSKVKSPQKKKNCIIDSDDSEENYKNDDSGNHDNKRNDDIFRSSENESNGINKSKETKIANQPCEEAEPKKRQNSKDENKQNEDINCDDIAISGFDNETAYPSSYKDVTNDKDDDSKKPIIKCVSLSKLLKPDVLQKDNAKPSKTGIVRSGKRLEFDVTKKNKMLQTAKAKKEEFWVQKRKEVSAFKPKEFVINITRLPNLNTEFLIKNNLNKIIKEGNAICEIDEDKSNSIVHQQSQSETECINQPKQSLELMTLSDDDPDNELIAQANKIKNSLLNESDSDSDIDKHSEEQAESTVANIKNALLKSDSDENEEQETDSTKAKENSKDNNQDKIKNALLNSDSDENEDQETDSQTKDIENSIDNNQDRISITQPDIENNKNSQKIQDKPGSDQCKTGSDTEAAKNYLLDKSESDMMDELPASHRNEKTPEKDLPTCNDDNAKKLLLCDTPDDKTEVPLEQRKSITPQSKKNRIRESVQAKNALLYSTSSESEDDQLSNTLNQIKLSLLDGLSDDEHKLKAKKLDEQRRSSHQSSSSEEDILKIVKKRKSSDSHSKSNKRKKRLIESDSDEEKQGSSNDELLSTSSSRKMVRSKAKPGNSSSHSSDTQDPVDKDIDGLTNLRSLNKSRRQNSDATEQSESSKSTDNRSRMETKQTGLIGEDILEAESSLDSASHDEDDAADEDLPPVTLPGFNGGLEHLVKEDLLAESDSSESNKEENKEDSDEEERLNAKRKKANAIASSDSETGTARKKDRDDDVRLSDFEDSDDSEVTKRAKRKKKGSDSDGSGGSSDAGKKKRRRIKSLNDSDMSGSDSENDGKNKHGRKNIRRVMGKNQLEEATKKAAREEKERVARIAERQKMYNNLQFDESGKPDEVILDKVVLDFDPETKEPLIAVDRGLVKKLKPHQANGIKFMWDACFESAKRLRKDKGSGCILAHCMGLGKTLQVVALTHTLLAHDSLTKVHRVLVVCPLSTVLNWVNEFKMWLKHAERESDIDVYELSRFKQNGERAFQLSQWFEHGGVCVLGYEMFRNLSADNNKKFRKKMLKNFQEALVDPGPDLVVCDEGHLLKNEKTSLSQSMNKVRTLRRIVLTGTPLQNNLKEYYCMVQFVKPNLLGKYNEYLNRFVNPITNGQYTDSTEHDIKIMKRRSHVLHKMLDGAVQRRDYGVLAPFLPPKHEYVLFITLTDVQTKLYQYYLDNFSRRPTAGKSSGFLFPDFQSLQRIWTHPLVLKYNSERYEIMQQKKRDKEEEDSEGSLVDFIDDESTPDESSSADSTDDSSELSDDSRKKSKKKKSSKKNKGKDKDKDKDKESTAAARRRGTRANPIDLDLEEEKDDDILEVKNENPTEWWIKMVEEDVLEDMRNSHKLVLLFDILRQCETIGDKLLVFSQSLYSLDLIEHFLGKVDEATQDGRIDEKLGNHVGSWSPGIDYFRLDGSTSCENRSIWCKNFNREDNPRARLFLISTRAGGLGINLVAANRVVIFDVSWNPSHDVQSIFRVYRFGQKKPCYVYRFLAMGTMEEKIYERQVTKQAISKRVIDEQQIDRHYAENDLAELYKFEAEPPTPRPIPPLPKDRLFAEMLREHEAQIYKYHEHDSLLENKEEETLSEEERKAAWEDFENEKNRPPPAPFPSPWPMHNGMVPNLLAQQQQQLAYAALSAMLRKDMPNVNDNQIRDMLPMIYNANPALMQKMADLFNYSQMNMTPAMLAQGGMNPASGMGGMGGASGLQYEPPWQRQQQQQQQMRLQQLMAQQQNMGAASKYYAGGLGSRDPVAMALQQQRAREIMIGGGGVGSGAGRPRGRPPLQPRAPPVAPPPADVVNLDSD